MLSCPVQVTKVDAGVEIQFHVFLALDLQGSGTTPVRPPQWPVTKRLGGSAGARSLAG